MACVSREIIRRENVWDWEVEGGVACIHIRVVEEHGKQAFGAEGRVKGDDKAPVIFTG